MFSTLTYLYRKYTRKKPTMETVDKLNAFLKQANSPKELKPIRHGRMS